MALYKTLGFVRRTGHYLKKSRARNASIPYLQKNWAEETLQRFGFDLHIIGTPAEDKSLVFVGNHISYIDIAVLLQAIPDVSFVAKKQVSFWPLFGHAAKAMNTVFVDRGSSASRSLARHQICDSLRTGRRIVVFPSGTTRLDESIPWRKGAFEAAFQTATRIQPFRLQYSQLRQTAYIDKDFFPFHIYNIARGPRTKVWLEFAPPQDVSEPIADCNKWYAWARQPLSHT